MRFIVFYNLNIITVRSYYTIKQCMIIANVFEMHYFLELAHVHNMHRHRWANIIITLCSIAIDFALFSQERVLK